jgi:hypothetical protein
MRGATGEVHAPSGDLDKEQHVQTLEPDRVNSQEIGLFVDLSAAI